jgi:hypothetical protein
MSWLQSLSTKPFPWQQAGHLSVLNASKTDRADRLTEKAAASSGLELNFIFSGPIRSHVMCHYNNENQ